ncbi:protein FAM83H isoform X2 [Genypterus blacodes]|uniref:protein FAM83H isoform X2 n=1 Tax=Genypterus blacodes TaxID=154954 RepID=UPI003F757D4E
MAHRSQSSSIGDNPLDPNYLPPHYREEYRLAIDALIESDTQGYQEFLKSADLVSFLAQPEIDHIKNSIHTPSLSSSLPELTYHDKAVEEDGSSDTYWPVQSDLAAPGLDLGWPQTQHSFVGPTEVTTLVNPSDPDMPSIKEQARRLIKNARQVVAVVMDTFTDVDIFSDLLDAAARHVPVYILLDEQDAHHFVSMVINCKVNLDLIHMIRVRTVAGITYYSRTGKSFKGQVKDRFLLADCRAVLSGNYSFMWSYEKIHRCIAHLFLGELVATFDEEFRILFAQSEPLSIDLSVVPLATDTSSSYLNSQFGLKRTQSLRNPMGFLRQPEIPSAFPYGDSDRNPSLSFRRTDPFRHTIEPAAGITIGKYSQQQFRLQQSFLEQGRSIVSRQLELNTFKRHSYAEGTQENYSSSRQYMKHRVMNNLEETNFHREQNQSSHYYHEGPGSGHGHYDRLRGLATQPALEQYSESNFRSELEPYSGNFGREYYSTEDLRGPEGLQGPPLAGRYDGGSSGKRPTIGQAYACQSSPTQPHPPEKQFFPKESNPECDEDSSVREGLRSWRINSYLSTYEDTGEEGLVQPLGPDAFEDPPPSQQPTAAESSAICFGTKEKPNVPSKPRPDILRPRFGKPILPDRSSQDSAPTTKDLISDYRPLALEKNERRVENDREREAQKDAVRELGVDMEVKEAPDLFLSKHESFRSRINPLLQRSSRLRSSLIFSSSKAEMHSGSLGLKSATEEDEGLDTVRTSSIVAQILEKRRSMSREPFDWRKKAEEKREREREETERQKEKDEKEKEEMLLKEKCQSKEELQKTIEGVKAPPTDEASVVMTEYFKHHQASSPNMTDPASRLQYFKDLAARRKATKIGTESSLKATEPAEKSQDVSDIPLNTSPPKLPSVFVSPAEPEPKKPDISTKLSELTHRPSRPATSQAKPLVIHLKPSDTSAHKEESGSEGLKKDIFKSLKPLPSPKIFRRDPLKLKGLTTRRSCGEEVLTSDATDAEKSEMKKSRSHSSSTLTLDDSKDGHHKVMGSNTSINTLGSEGKGEGKTLDFLKKQTQRLKGFLGPKDKDKKSAADDRTMSTVMEIADDSSKNNLRDDTKVILEQISANSQKVRHEREEAGGDKDGAAGEKGLERQNSMKRSRFLRPQGTNIQEREGLLKRIESLRKEKKVYSRFEMGNSLA